MIRSPPLNVSIFFLPTDKYRIIRAPWRPRPVTFTNHSLVHIFFHLLLMIFLSRWRGIIRHVPSSAPWPAKQERPAGGGWRSLLRRSSQSNVCKKRREGEKISENNELPFNNFYTPFLYPYVLYVSFTPVKHRALCRRLISSLTWFDWFHKYRRLPATKVIVRGPILSGVRNPTWRANLAPPWVGKEYSLTPMLETSLSLSLSLSLSACASLRVR
jgi:hypothetical protein